MSNLKNPPPPHVRPKVGKTPKVAEKLALAAKYLAAQAGAPAPQGPALAVVATALKTARDATQQTITARGALVAALGFNRKDYVTDLATYEYALSDYAYGAARLAVGDIALLSSLGVDAAKKGVRGAGAAVGIPSGLKCKAGALPGEADLSCKRTLNAGAFIFQYKLEPSLPTDPWLPGPVGLLTKDASVKLEGLAKGQALRFRVCAIGAAPGPWSAELVGHAG